jgi:hypothetical protein
VSNRSEALELVHLIAEQGEGAVAKPAGDSHFQRFLEMFRSLSSSELPLPVLPLPSDPILETGAQVSPERQITHPAGRALCSLLDLRYRMLLTQIAITLQLPDGGASGPLRGQLAVHAVRAEMRDGISALAEEIRLLPRLAGGDASVAPCGPTFSEHGPNPARTAAQLAQDLLDDITASGALMGTLRRPAAEGGHGLDLTVFEDIAEHDRGLTEIATRIRNLP